MCSLSETSSTGGGLYSNQDAEFLAVGTAAQARSTAAAQLAALLTGTSGKALLQQHLSTAVAPEPAVAAPCMEDSSAKAQHQETQLTALLSTESGKALMQQRLSELIKHKHFAALQQEQQKQLPVTPTTHIDCSNVCAAAAAAGIVAEQADETTCSLSDLHPRVLSTAIAVSRTAPGSADRAAGLALLKQELLQHAPLSTALALAAAGAGNSKLVEVAAAALSKVQPSQEPQQQQDAYQQQQVKAPLSPSNSDMAANGEPLTCAAAWSMLQQQRQQQQLQSQESILAGARSLGLLRNDTLQSTQSMSMRQDSAIDPASLGQVSQGVSRGGSQQMVFKRRTTNSTALRRHFSSANKPSRSEPSGINKPQQLFKKQRKRPLMLWSSTSSLQQQFSSLKQQQQQGTMPAYSQPVEPENSTLTASSSGATGPAVQALLDGQLPASNAAAAALLGTRTSGVDNVLSTLARQEQQLLKLQQQLREQRELIFFCRQAQQSQVPGAAAVPSAAALEAVKALELELLLSNQAASSAAAPMEEPMRAPAADVDMPDAYQLFASSAAAAAHQQHEEPEPAVVNADAISTFITLAKTLMARQQPQLQQAAAPAAPALAAAAATAPAAVTTTAASQGWDPDVVRKLTAALLAA